jgi:phenylacetate-CoA ligase
MVAADGEVRPSAAFTLDRVQYECTPPGYRHQLRFASIRGSSFMGSKSQEQRRLLYWESEVTRPHIQGASSQADDALKELSQWYLPKCLQHPFRPLEDIRAEQFKRIQHLVELAYNDIPVYANKYRAAGFKPSDLKSWADYERLPIITKDELVEAFPHQCVNPRWPIEDLFSTRSSGSSGKTLLIKVNLDAILLDTVQGIRQLWLQSGLKYSRDQLAAHVYTVPWWFESVGGDFSTAFISGLIPPQTVSAILDELGPHVLSCYPTNLKALLPYWDDFDRSNLYLAVVHSEASSPLERQSWTKQLGVPVLDEYSSEEATRIALELPCGHYHVCEDSVYLEVLEPETLRPQEDGTAGLCVVTNLLNEAMPFLRYSQGDHVTRPVIAAECLVGWSQLASLDGRINDSFVNAVGRVVPAGTILDLMYRWMFDAGVHFREFELIQRKPDEVELFLVTDGPFEDSRIRASMSHMQDLLEVCMDHPVTVKMHIVRGFPKRAAKRRPIRCALQAEQASLLHGDRPHHQLPR